jgi:hypothetical protein
VAPKLNKKIIINVAGLIIIVGAAVAFYILFAGPRVKVWRESRAEIKKRTGRLNELKKRFGNQSDPRVELLVLKKELENLRKANRALEKLKKAGVETKDLPPELNDKDQAIRRELYRDYMKDVMDATEDRIKKQLRDAQISPPDLELYNNLQSAAEAAYYMNRAAGLQGIINAIGKTKTEDAAIAFDKLSLENYKQGQKGRKGAINILKYGVDMTMDVESLMSFIYHLKEEDGYYYIEQMDITPGATRRGARSQPLEINAKIGTLLVFKSEEKKQVKQAAAKTAARKKKKKGGGSGFGGLLGLAAAMKDTVKDEKAAARNKKWYEFWK